MTSAGFWAAYHAPAYNGLLSVEEADGSARQDGALSDFLASTSRILRSYGLESRFGVALLHKHCSCAEDECMIESPEASDGRRALVTRPSSKQPHGLQARPTVWQLDGDAFRPLEFSSDLLACSLVDDGEVAPGFLADFREMIRRSSIGPVMGLAVVARELYEDAQGDEVAVESSDSAERTNTVTLRSPIGLEGQTIETAWGFTRADDPVLGCLASCRKYCWSIPGGHDKQHEKHHHPEPGT